MCTSPTIPILNPYLSLVMTLWLSEVMLRQGSAFTLTSQKVLLLRAERALRSGLGFNDVRVVELFMVRVT